MWAKSGWPAEPDDSGTGITAPFNAPSLGVHRRGSSTIQASHGYRSRHQRGDARFEHAGASEVGELAVDLSGRMELVSLAPCDGRSITPPENDSKIEVASCVRRGAASGELSVGEQLPPAAELAVALSVDRNTVLAAYRDATRRRNTRVPARARGTCHDRWPSVVVGDRGGREVDRHRHRAWPRNE